MQITNSKELNGCIVLVKGHGFLSKQIMFHMAILAKYSKRKPVKYSHAEFLLWDDSAKFLWTIGAREKGIEENIAAAWYKDKEYIILKPIEPLTKKQTEMAWDYWWTINQTPYQRGNFLAWIGYLKTHLWLGSKSDRRMYCYEAAARFADAVGRWYDSPLGVVSVYDLLDNPNYKVIE